MGETKVGPARVCSGGQGDGSCRRQRDARTEGRWQMTSGLRDRGEDRVMVKMQEEIDGRRDVIYSSLSGAFHLQKVKWVFTNWQETLCVRRCIRAHIRARWASVTEKRKRQQLRNGPFSCRNCIRKESVSRMKGTSNSSHPSLLASNCLHSDALTLAPLTAINHECPHATVKGGTKTTSCTEVKLSNKEKCNQTISFHEPSVKSQCYDTVGNILQMCPVFHSTTSNSGTV